MSNYDSSGGFYGKDGGKYKTQWDKAAADTRYDQQKKQIEQLERSNDIAEKQMQQLKRAHDLEQQQINNENLRQYIAESMRRRRMEFYEFVERENERIIKTHKLCEKVGLKYELLADFRTITSDFNWNKYYYEDRNLGSEILNKLDCSDIENKIVEKLRSSRNYYYVFLFLLICGVFGIFISLLSEDIALIIMAIIMSTIFLVPFIITKRRYNVSLKELDKLKKFFDEYVSAGKNAFKDLESYMTENYNEEIIQVIEEVLEIQQSISINKTRVEKLNENKDPKEKISQKESEKYNYAIAQILDNYDSQVNSLTDSLKKDFII